MLSTLHIQPKKRMSANAYCPVVVLRSTTNKQQQPTTQQAGNNNEQHNNQPHSARCEGSVSRLGFANTPCVSRSYRFTPSTLCGLCTDVSGWLSFFCLSVRASAVVRENTYSEYLVCHAAAVGWDVASWKKEGGCDRCLSHLGRGGKWGG